MTVGLSFASTCPFAKFAKTGDNGVPELDHEKLNNFVAKMKEYAPVEASALEEKRHSELQNIHQIPHGDFKADL